MINTILCRYNMLSVTSVRENTLVDHKLVGHAYGYSIRPKDIVRVLDDPEITAFAEDQGYRLAIDESGAEKFTELIRRLEALDKTSGITLYTKYDDSGDKIPHYAVLGVLYNIGSLSEDLDFLGISNMKENLTPLNFYHYVVSGRNRMQKKASEIMQGGTLYQYSDIAQKLICAVQYGTSDLASVLEYNKYTISSLWKTYFANLHIDDLVKLVKLQDTITTLFKAVGIKKPPSKIASIYMTHSD